VRKSLLFLWAILFAIAPVCSEVANASDESKDDDRLRNCGTVLTEILDVPDNIPQDLLDRADCLVVFPSVLKAAFIVGGSYG
jgi:SH3 domain-containing YSC84-like protein 1